MRRSRALTRLPKDVEPRRLALVAVALAAAVLVVVLPGAFARWFLPKETVFVAAIVVAALLPAAGRVPRLAWALFGAAGIVLALAALTGESPLAQLLGRAPRFEGLVSVPVYVGAVWFGARMFGPAPAGRRRASDWTVALALAAVAIGAVAILEAAGLRPIPSDLDRPGSLLGNATDQGIVGAVLAMLLAAPIVRAFASRRPERGTVLSVGLVASVLTVLLSGSRAGLLALGVGGALLLVGHLVLRHRDGAPVRPLLTGAAIASLGIAVLVVVVPGVGARVAQLTPAAAQTVSDRFLIWGETLELLSTRLGLGVGPSGYIDAIVGTHGAEWYRTVPPGTILDSPHSLPLQALSAGGLPLLALGIALAAVTVVAGIRRLAIITRRTDGPRDRPLSDPRERDLLVAALAGTTAIVAALSTHFTSATTAILAGILIGILLARPAAAPAAGASRALRGARVGLLLVWAIALGITTSADLAIESALRARTALESDTQFAIAAALRPWDGDLASVAARSFAARADFGDPDAAQLGVQWGNRALQLIPSDTPARLALGTSHRLAGDVEESLAVLGPLAESQVGDRDIAVQYGLSLAASGDGEQAREIWEAALALHPGDRILLELLAVTSDS